MNLSTYEIARRLLDSGVSLIPIATDGRKRPAVAWKEFQSRHPTGAELRDWFDRRSYGMAALCGEISELECFDFDRGALLEPWLALVAEEAPYLLPRLTINRTPREPSGFHAWLRCVDCPAPGNTKLASEPGPDGRPVTLVESRGAGGYAILPGSPGTCHPSGRPWLHHAGPPLWDLGAASVEEREVAWKCARYLDRTPAEQTPLSATGLDLDRLRPGQDFDKRGPDWSDLLEPHGWRCVHHSGQERRWLRPGKETGWSATTGVCRSRSDGADLFRVFSSNAAPFEADHAYGKFRAVALLQHGGDLAACASRLGKLGYGDKPSPRHNSHPASNDVERLLAALAKADPAALQAVLAPVVRQILDEGKAES